MYRHRLPYAASRIAFALTLTAWVVMSSLAQVTPPYRNPALPVEERVTDLLARMSLEEKVAQLQSSMRRGEWQSLIPASGLGGVGPLLRPLTARQAADTANAIQRLALEHSRLGIPVMIHDEALHGLVANGATSFPQAIALAATWNTALMERVATVIGRQARSRGIRQLLSPVVNIARDVRWGRVEETYGEDTYLTTRMGVAFCRSIEQQQVVTTPKHFIANVGDGGRDSHPIHMSERILREVYFPPFLACFREAGSLSVMAAYNALNDEPCSSNRWLLTDLLRREWDFKGFVVSDYGSVGGIRDRHSVSASDSQTARLALHAGLDVELPDIYYFGQPLLEAARNGSVSRESLDEAVRNVLRAKFTISLFENPYVDPVQAERLNDTPEDRALAREAAREAVVLLKNDGGVLPLKSTVRTLAVIGPNADREVLGGYSGFGMDVVTPLEGITKAVSSSTRVVFAKGCDVGFASLPAVPAECLTPPDGTGGGRGLRGEYFNAPVPEGTPVLTRVDRTIDFEWAMGSPDPRINVDRFSARWTGTLTPQKTGTYTLGASTDDGVRLYLDGKLLIDSWFDRGATLDVVTVKLEAGRAYTIRMDYYENTGWTYARLGWRFEDGVDEEMNEAVRVAQGADAAVIVVGIIEGEGYDRASLDLPGRQEQLIRSVAATGTPTVVVLVTGSAVTVKNWSGSVPGILQAWYGGEEGGSALADVLFGRVSPSGKLPMTFPQFAGQTPLYYNTKPSGRGYDYTDMSGKPQFPFGHGLSYTTFRYSNLSISPKSITPSGTVSVTLDIENSGTVAGSEVVQLYLRDVVASVTTPLKELKSFQKVSLSPQQRSTVRFTLSSDQLSLLDRQMRPVVEPGRFEVMVGSSSEDIRLKGSFDVVPQ